jgi:hypothetical protein
MRYKTIVLELLLDQYPAFHERLRQERTLLSTLDRLAMELKNAQVAWMNELSRASPKRDINQIATEAMELALEHVRGTLPPESADGADNPISLSDAMAFVRKATPSA